MKFYARIPYSVIHVMVNRDGNMLCEQASFTGKLLDTEDTTVRDPELNAACEKYLASIANRPGSGISTDSDEDIDAAIEAEKDADLRRVAEESHRKMLAAGLKT